MSTARSLRAMYRRPVLSAKGRRVGRVAGVLFHPERPVVVGFIVERPRILFVLDRRDRYLALAGTESRGDGGIVAIGADSWDRKAAKRLGVDWDATVVWVGMPVRSEGGKDLGVVRDGLFDPSSGEVEALGLSGGAAADLAVGVRDIDGRHVRGYRAGQVLVAEEAAAVDLSGGVAAAAGKGAAVARHEVGKAAKTAAAYGKAAAKVAAESNTGKKAIGWLKSMRDELVDAMGDPDDDK